MQYNTIVNYAHTLLYQLPNEETEIRSQTETTRPRTSLPATNKLSNVSHSNTVFILSTVHTLFTRWVLYPDPPKYRCRMSSISQLPVPCITLTLKP